MLGRMIGSRYDMQPYDVVDKSLQDVCNDGDLTVANLESPVTYTKDPDADHLQFIGNENILSEFKWIDVFSLANNHINDAGEIGMDETVNILNKNNFKHNGLFSKESDYFPLYYKSGSEELAIISVTDMMNIPFAADNKWQCLRVGEERMGDIIKREKARNRMVIVFAHIGALFTRFPNPTTFDYLHSYVDDGADCIVTAHSHCLGGMEIYKGVPIFHSIGDFVMDGNSFRRRQSVILTLNISENKVYDWKITPAVINDEFKTVTPNEKIQKKLISSFNHVTKKIATHTSSYRLFYKWQYKMEIVHHTFSTMRYLFHVRGLFGMLRLLFIRFEEVARMLKWMITDRSKVQCDNDAIKADRKKIKNSDILL